MMLRTLIFCTAYAPDLQTWEQRYRHWINACRLSGIHFDQLLIVDDGSPVLPEWHDLEIICSVDELRETPLLLYHFPDRLGRPGLLDYPGWFRSFCFAARYAEQFGFEKIVHIESDAYVVSERMAGFINRREEGWVGFWLPRYEMPESAMQIIVGQALQKFYHFTKQSYAAFVGKEIERNIPFTEVVTEFKGDRYGEGPGIVPLDADWTVQVHQPAWGAMEYFWWMQRPDRPSGYCVAELRSLAADFIPIFPGQEVRVQNISIFSNLEVFNPEFAKSLQTNAYATRTALVKDVALVRLPRDAVVFARDGYPVLVGTAFVDDQLAPWLRETAAQLASIASEPREVVPVEGEMLLLARFGEGTWGHWLGELVPRAVVAEHFFPGRFTYVVPEWTTAGAWAASQVCESLLAYGIADDRLLRISSDKNYRFGTLWTMTSARSGGIMHPAVLDVMRQTVLVDQQRPNDQLPQSTLIVRNADGRRSISNHAEVSDYLLGEAFVPADLRTMSFRDQVSLFRSSKSVFAVLGSDLTGLIYSPDYVQVIAAAPEDWGDDFFYPLIQLRCGRYAEIRGPIETLDEAKMRDSSFSLALDDLKAALEASQARGEMGRSQPQIAFQLLAHISNRGDVWFEEAQLAGADSADTFIEGFVLLPTPARSPRDIEYQATMADGVTTPMLNAGEFCGTRGKGRSLIGFSARALGALADDYECEYVADFADGTRVGPLRQGEMCRSPGLASLKRMQIRCVPRRISPAAGGHV